MEISECFNNLVSCLERININKITLLTGRNSSGKSLIRKQMPFHIGDELGILPKNVKILETSMEARSSINENSVGLNHDISWLATSSQTIHSIKVKLNLERFRHYTIIDEPELGVGEELQLGLVDYLNDKLIEFKEKNMGILIITHSKLIANKIIFDDFINLDGFTYDEWINRIPVKLSLDDFENFSNGMFTYIRDLNKNEKNI